MNKSKLCNLIGIVILSLIAIPLQSQAANPNTKQSDKERLVLMPLRVDEEDKNLLGAMETALVEGLKLKYDVFSGEQVSQKARQIFLKESRNTSHTECDETRCMQNIAEAFQAELIATANVTKQGGGYFLALSIQNIFDNKVEFSKTLTCEGCNAFKVVEKLKILGGVVISNANDTDNEETQADRKLKAEQLKKEQQAFEEKLRNADAAERKRLLDAKAQDDKHLAELKAAALARRKNAQAESTAFPTLELAQPEISKLNEKIAAIEAGYEKELSDTHKQVEQRYSEKLAALNNEQKDDFESKDEFKARQEKKRTELNSQRDAELARLNISTVAETETAPFKARIKALTEHEYIVGAEGIEAELGSYDAEEHQFSVNLSSKNATLKLKLNTTIPLQSTEAKVFKQQWQTGLVRPEAKARFNGDLVEVSLLNDSDNSRLINYAGRFITSKAIAEAITKANAKLRMIKEGYVFQGGLTWMPINSAQVPWRQANSYCSSTAINGLTGWRLPTSDELQVLYNSGAMNNQGWTVGDTWSSTPNSSNGLRRHTVNLGTGFFLEDGATTESYRYVTCVTLILDI